jgi:hypothetical protein
VIKALMKAPMIAALRGLGRSMTRKNNKPQSQDIKALMAANCARQYQCRAPPRSS